MTVNRANYHSPRREQAASARPIPSSGLSRHGAVDAVVPDLLARRDIEPPPNRLAPATLAAIFHSRGQVVAGRARPDKGGIPFRPAPPAS
jgi:hypothetical protein